LPGRLAGFVLIFYFLLIIDFVYQGTTFYSIETSIKDLPRNGYPWSDLLCRHRSFETKRYLRAGSRAGSLSISLAPPNYL